MSAGLREALRPPRAEALLHSWKAARTAPRTAGCRAGAGASSWAVEADAFVPLVACHPERLCQPQLLQSLGLAPWAFGWGDGPSSGSP